MARRNMRYNEYLEKMQATQRNKCKVQHPNKQKHRIPGKRETFRTNDINEQHNEAVFGTIVFELQRKRNISENYSKHLPHNTCR